MAKKYIADIIPLNDQVIGTKAHGRAEFTQEGNNLNIKIEMFDTPPNIQHWGHFHGFPKGQNAEIATMSQDTNQDGVVDLPETENVSGTTMVPFDNAPHHMHIPHDNYPVADKEGYYSYEVDVPLVELQKSFKASFGAEDLELEKRVIYIHGVPEDFSLPDTVAGEVGDYGVHVTLPIATGKIVAAD